MEEGAPLPPLQKQVTQEQVIRYAQASKDFNPLHLDPAFAAQGPFGQIVAHGMLAFAFVSEMLTLVFGQAWLETGRLTVRFRAPVAPGDTITAAGQVTKVTQEADGHEVACSVVCRNREGDEVVSGRAWVRLPADWDFKGGALP